MTSPLRKRMEAAGVFIAPLPDAVTLSLDDHSLTEVYDPELPHIIDEIEQAEKECPREPTGHVFIAGHCIFCGEPA